MRFDAAQAGESLLGDKAHGRRRRRDEKSGLQRRSTYLAAHFGQLSRGGEQLESKERIFAVADLHSLTIRREAREVRENTLSLLAQFLAFGLDEKRNIIYVQSHVPAHTQLAWILNCYTYVGEMSRMTQFKDKSAKHADNVNMGLMDYPVLMAADILLYDTDLVPVGVDQVQHLEIARDIAIRFNNIYGETFKVPEALLGRAGAKIMSLTDPTAKMSKSDPNPMGRINVLDSEADIVKKFKRAVTDSESVIAYDPEKKPGVSNLLAILAAAKGTTPEQEAGECEGLMYGHLKLRAAEAVSAMLRPVRERYEATDTSSSISRICSSRTSRFTARFTAATARAWAKSAPSSCASPPTTT